MSRVLRIITIGVVAVCAVGSAFALRKDIAQISFAPFLQSWNLFLLAIALTFLNYTLRIIRWRWYMACSGHDVSPRFAALTYVAGFAFTLSPGKLGELMKARYYTAVGIPLRDVIAAFSVERLMDLLALLTLTLLIWYQLPHYRGMEWAAAAAIAVGSALLVLLPSETTTPSFKCLSKLSPHFARAGTSIVNSLHAARSLLSVRTVIFGFLMALLAWGFEGLGLGILASMFSPFRDEPGADVGIYAVSVLLGAISFLPGGVGSTEAIMTALLVSQGSPLAAAILTTLACRITTLWLGVSLGWAAVATLRSSLQPQT